MLPIKKDVINFLENREYNAIMVRCPTVQKAFNILISLSYDKTSLVSWRAIEAIGVLSGQIAVREPETVRNLTGRLLWMIRDESGGIGWSCPEMLGEIVLNNPELCADIAPIIVSFHDEKMLLQGVLWAIGRMGAINNDTTAYAIPVVLQYLQSNDDIVRGYAVIALGSLGALGAVPLLKAMINDSSVLPCYTGEKIETKTVGELAADAVSKISGIG